MRKNHQRWGVAGLAALLSTTGFAAMGPVGHAATPREPSPEVKEAKAVNRAAPVECPDPVPLAEVEAGVVGTGHSVMTGRTVETFDAEVIGVLHDGIGPGRDLIIAELSGPPIDKAGGVWAGMSGSPVYVGDQLLGAVSYSMSGSSTLAGVTPAEDMLDLFDLAAAGTEAAAAKHVDLSPELRAEVAKRFGKEAANAGLDRLRVPVSVSSTRADRIDEVAEALERSGYDIAVVRGGRADAPAGGDPADGQLAGGDNFVAALSYGDVTAAAIGTTTLTCDGTTLAFGHPFQLLGATTLGASAGDALGVVTDPVFGAYKLANIAESVGTVDQDRLAGLRAVLGETPTTIPVRSNVTSLDSGKSRAGASDVAAADLTADIAVVHLLDNIDSVWDKVGGGSSRVVWKVKGVTASGKTFELRHGNKYVSQEDISLDSLGELEDQLWQIATNPYTDVTFTGIKLEADVSSEASSYTLGRVETSVAGGPFRTGAIDAMPGDEIRVRATLKPDKGPNRVVTTKVTVPDNARGYGELAVGNLSDWELSGEEFAAANAGKFDQLLEELANAPRNDEVGASLWFEKSGVKTTRAAKRTDQVVHGTKYLEVGIIPPH